MKKILLLLQRERQDGCIVFYKWRWSIYFRMPVSNVFFLLTFLSLFFQLMQPGYGKREETLFHTSIMESHRKNKNKIIVYHHFKTSFRVGSLTTKAFIAIRKIKTGNSKYIFFFHCRTFQCITALVSLTRFSWWYICIFLFFHFPQNIRNLTKVHCLKRVQKNLHRH